MSDAWDDLRRLTRARIGLGRAGDALPTAALLDLQMAHARARDAVHGQVDWARIGADLAPLPSLTVRSAAPDRATYLRRPDLGRRLEAGEADRLPQGPLDLVFVIADGLSAAAVQNHAVATLRATQFLLREMSIGPVVLATQARVALGDCIGAAMNARVVVMLIGERPGLSAADSLGAYLTFAPAPGRRDSERNCVSNIHADGLSPQRAAGRLAWLVREALKLGMTGVGLKEAAPQFSAIGVEPKPKIEG
jgi:ethanolamine ammonia-lyase small subunit